MYNYTNVGFMLAGLITETVSGTFYRKYLEANVFNPLGMDRTYFLPEEVIADGDFAYGDQGEDYPYHEIRDSWHDLAYHFV